MGPTCAELRGASGIVPPFLLSSKRPSGRSRKSNGPSSGAGSCRCCCGVSGSDLVQTAEINYCPRPLVMDVEFPPVVYLNDQNWDSWPRSTSWSLGFAAFERKEKQQKVEQNEVAMNQAHLLEATEPKELVGRP